VGGVGEDEKGKGREAIGKIAKEKVIIYFETKSNRKNIVIADVE
jgi:hypothetical protein